MGHESYTATAEGQRSTTFFPPQPHTTTSTPKRVLSRDERWILRVLGLVMCIIAFPSKFLYLFGAPLFTALMMWRGTFLLTSRFLTLSVSLVAVSTLSLVIDYHAGIEVSFFGMLFWLLTHMPFLLVLSAQPNLQVRRELIDRLASFVAAFVLIQSAVCLVSIVLVLKSGGFNGDYISGTFGILDWFGKPTINHVFFTLCMFSALVFLWEYRSRVSVKLALSVGPVVTVLAQSGHQTFFFVLAMLVAAMAGHSAPLRLVGAALSASAAGLLILGIMILAYPNSLVVAEMWYDKVVNAENSPKRMVIDAVLGSVISPKVVLLGTGFGQFSSRAALFACGWYAPEKLPGALVFMTERTEQYLVPALIRHEIAGEGSAMAQPMFSYVSLSTEAGLPLTLAFLAAVGGLVFRAWRHARVPGEQAHYGRYAIFFVVFMALSCGIENYLEFTQGLFLPLILLVVGMARARTLSESSRITG
ncbi:MAG: hypothetical protein KTR25_00225 [Myxococcales bacterium]|nr:hypothetical protein [Myxococcales bacterium]